LAHPRKYSVNGGRYLLVEFAEMFNIASMEAILRQLREQGLIPVLTHPERNPVFQQHPELAPRYIELGCIVQVTASSLTGDFGKQAARSAADLLDRNLIHVLASDGHSTRHRLPRLSEAAQFVAERKDVQLARALVSDNPAAIIADRPLPYRPNGAVRTSRKKGLWSRFRS
jgi:protein-tyrosine phosphatase